MKEQYNEVEMEIIEFNCMDVIATSPWRPEEVTTEGPTDGFF